MFNSSFEWTSAETPEAAANDAGEGGERSETLTNTLIGTGLDRIAQLLESGPRVRREALRRAAALIRAAPEPLVRSVEQRGVEAVHALGIDYELSGLVTDWVRSGRLRLRERLETQRRRELSELPGIGPKLAKELSAVLGVVDLPSLARAARDGQLSGVYGFGPKRVKAIEAVLAARGQRAG